MTTNRLVLLGDLHFGIKSDSPDFLEYQFAFFETQFFPYLLANNIRRVVQFGDFFDRRKFVNYNLLHKVKNRFLKWFDDNEVRLDVFLGNHDVSFSRTNTVNSFDLVLTNTKYTYWHTSPVTLDFDGLPIALLPWINEENLSESLDFVADTPAKVLFGHLELNGFEVQPGHLMQAGMGAKPFERFDLVCSGHYHGYSERGNIVYLGVPYQLTWGDFGTPKGFWTFDLSTPTREGLEFHETTVQMFHRISYDDTSTDYDKLDQEYMKQFTGRIVTVSVNQKTNQPMFDRFMDLLYKLNPLEITVEELALGFFERENQIEHKDQTTPQLIEEYIDAAPEMSYDKSRLKRLMVDLYTKATIGTPE